jgi:hypothetical protein
MLVLMPTCGLGLPKDQKAVVFTCTVDLLISTTLFVLWALAFAVLGLSSSVTLGKVRGFLALRKSLGCLFDPSPLDMSIAQGS